jgi:hypothetical protein
MQNLARKNHENVIIVYLGLSKIHRITRLQAVLAGYA